MYSTCTVCVRLFVMAVVIDIAPYLRLYLIDVRRLLKSRPLMHKKRGCTSTVLYTKYGLDSPYT